MAVGIAPSDVLTLEIQAASDRGWRLLPVQRNGKVPLLKDWTNNATFDTEQLETWVRQWPGCNWSVATGPASGIFALDVDGEAGESSLIQYESEGFQLPDTLTVTTGRGRHIYFRWPQGQTIRNSVGSLAPGLDIRGDGGCAVIPPSVHPSGARYLYLEPDSAIADPPDWLLAKLTRPKVEAVKASRESGLSEGKRNSSLASLAGRLRRKGMNQGAIEERLLAENASYAPPLEADEVKAIAASISRYPPAQPRRPDVLCLGDVKPEAVDWLWEPYIPRKMITLLSGDPGVGKTALALALAARLSRGEGMGEGESCEPGNVLYLTLENSPSHVLRPRFDALRGDSNRFFLLRGTIGENDQSGGITLADTGPLEEAISRHSARMIVIDPLQSFLGAGVDAHRANETRPLMDGMIRLAESTGCALLITRHLSKAVGSSAIYRGMGSIDLTGAARCELLVARDPEDSSRVIMAHSKSNLGPLGPSLAFSIADGGVVTWCGESRHKADDLLAGPPSAAQRGAREEAKEYLRDALAGGPQPSTEIQEQAKGQGISFATLRRAQADLGIVKRPTGFGKSWTLELPSVAQNPSESLTA